MTRGSSGVGLLACPGQSGRTALRENAKEGGPGAVGGGRGGRARQNFGQAGRPVPLRFAVVLAIAALGSFLLNAQQPGAEAQAIARLITANELKADVSFLASDALEGRGTPSRGQDVAAEFLAAEFRRAGLEPAGDDGFFQTASYVRYKPGPGAVRVSFRIGERELRVDPAKMGVLLPAAADVVNAEAVWRTQGAGGNPDEYKGKAVLSRGAIPTAEGAVMRILFEANASRLDTATRVSLLPADAAPVPLLLIWDEKLREALEGGSDIRVTAHIPPPIAEPVTLRNVIGILRGRDAALSDSYLALTAHYDHLGMRPEGQVDGIFNGANDNASGAATVAAAANALAALPNKPERSIVFIEFFGEELGLWGSRYYVRHPAVPLERTIADINLEQLGRTDTSEGGRHEGMLNLTGFDFTTLAGAFQGAGTDCGVKIEKDAALNERYFAASDNAAFALAGVPSTTASVTYEFPDYHGVGDEWPKIDYENMAHVACAVTAAAWRLANSAEAPKWNAANPQVERYLKTAPAAAR